jgi:aldehyde dehydrogenase (NAD+)
MIEYQSFYIGGEWRRPAGAETLVVRNPATEEVIGVVPRSGDQDIDAAVEAARRAFDDPDGWPHWSAPARAEVLGRFADELTARAAQTAERVSIQNGMPITLAENFEGGFPPLLLRYYSQLMIDAPG